MPETGANQSPSWHDRFGLDPDFRLDLVNDCTADFVAVRFVPANVCLQVNALQSRFQVYC